MVNEKMSEKLPEIRKTVVLEAPIEKVWKAVSTSEGIEGWWMPNTLVAERGREFTLHAGKYGDSECRIIEIEPPHKLSFTWDKEWTVTFELEETDEGKTEFTLTHSGWFADKKTRFGQPHTTVRGVMEEGWAAIVDERLSSFIKG